MNYLQLAKDMLACPSCKSPTPAGCQCCDICGEPAVIKAIRDGQEIYECKNCTAVYAKWEREGRS